MNRLRRRDSSPPPPPSPFFKLSRELRDIIYGEVFGEMMQSGRPRHRKFMHPYDSFAVEHDYSGQEVVHGAVWTADALNGYGLLAVCDQIRAEAMPFAVRGTEFDFRWVLKRQMSTRGWNTHGRVSDPWMHSISFINNNSVALRSLLYCSLATNIRFVTLQHELMERETWSYSTKKNLSWWPKHVKLERLTIVVLSKHEDRRYAFSWMRQSIIEKFLEIWQLVVPKQITKKLVIEAQELCSEETLSDDFANQLSEACKSLLGQEIVGSLPNEVVVSARPTLDVKATQQSSERVQDSLTQKKAVPITLAMMSIIARTDENRNDPAVKDVEPFHDCEDAEASLIKPFPGPRPRDSWEFSEEMMRVHGSHRRRWSRRHRRLLRSEEAGKEDDLSESETEKLFNGIKNEVTHALQRARCVLKAKRRTDEASDNGESSSSESYAGDPLQRSILHRQKKQKNLKRERSDAGAAEFSAQPAARRRRTHEAPANINGHQPNVDVGKHTTDGCARPKGEPISEPLRLARPQPGAKPTNNTCDRGKSTVSSTNSGPSSPQHLSAAKADLDALMQERNRLDAEILSRLTKMRGEVGQS